MHDWSLVDNQRAPTTLHTSTVKNQTHLSLKLKNPRENLLRHGEVQEGVVVELIDTEELQRRKL